MTRKPILVQLCAVLSFCPGWCRGQDYRPTLKPPVAGVRVHITIDEVVGRKMQSDPMPKLKLYLLRVEDTRSLVELQEGCRRVTADANANPYRVYQTCDQNLRQALTLVPTLPALATAETDRDGQYEFAEVPAAARYNVVALKKVDDGEPLVIVGVTNKLKPGEHVTLNLSANDPWTRAATP